MTEADLLKAARSILLDFDGPVCDVYAGSPAAAVADQLRRMVAAVLPSLPDDLVATQDPLHVLHRTADLAPEVAPRIEKALQQAELDAVESATLTPGVADFLTACAATNRPVAIVSNNSAPAIHAYLVRVGLDGMIQRIAGRDPDDPRLMKPDTHLLQTAVDELAAQKSTTLLIGDSLTDIEGGHAFGIPVIALANKPHKVDAFAAADAVITTMTGLAASITTPPATDAG